MICENMIEAGFMFMLGKTLFEIALLAGGLGCVIAFWLIVNWMSRRTK